MASKRLKYEELPEVNSERWLSLEDLPGEEWRPVVGYEDEYRISNYGRLYTNARNGLPCGKMVSVSYCGRYGRIGLRKNGERISYSLHRLVAEAFIPNDNNLPQIDHINNNRKDNRVDNLRWVTAKQNLNNPITVKVHRVAMEKLRNNEQSKKVAQKTKEGVIVRVYESIREAQRQTGIPKSNIAAAACGKKRWATDHWATIRSAGGYKWEFVN